ncbi:unnamed protein product [Nesidiocoris tenuis]|uniref:Uncharacterized protein n=1 Tax=Nesidiocoris tenuis TaxID=355587 RepID=A0A6H5H5U4_9HEMI|nr:unnamed protein product [Nesidiocoris tenuis]
MSLSNKSHETMGQSGHKMRHSANQRSDRHGWRRPPTAQTAGRGGFVCRIFRDGYDCPAALNPQPRPCNRPVVRHSSDRRAGCAALSQSETRSPRLDTPTNGSNRLPRQDWIDKSFGPPMSVGRSGLSRFPDRDNTSWNLVTLRISNTSSENPLRHASLKKRL